MANSANTSKARSTLTQTRTERTAIARKSISRPVRDAIRDGVIRPGCSILDYGSGRGDDARILRELGYAVQAWDPCHAPTPPPREADVVNLGYVLNVIADPVERSAVLMEAFRLARQTLIVAAYVHNGEATKTKTSKPAADGVITGRGSFQKLFYHRELGDYIEAVLGRPAARADFGVFYVHNVEPVAPIEEPRERFGEPAEAFLITFAASHMRTIGPKLKRELTQAEQALSESEWGGFKGLCLAAKELLDRRLTPKQLSTNLKQLTFGKKTREAVYIHAESLCELPPDLRLEVAIADTLVRERYTGDWSLVKFNLTGASISLLETEPFDEVDHPALIASYQVDLQERTVRCRRESQTNPSIYHRTELFFHPDHRWYAAFQSLTEREEALGMLDRADIGRRRHWNSATRRCQNQASNK